MEHVIRMTRKCHNVIRKFATLESPVGNIFGVTFLSKSVGLPDGTFKSYESDKFSFKHVMEQNNHTNVTTFSPSP